MIRVCFHGAESTGKSTLAMTLAEEGVACVPEYGRDFAETRGTDFTMADLLAIAAGQDALMRQAAAARPPLLILDTDPLMTAAWAEMLFGEIPEELFGYEKAEHYLLFAADTPWFADGTRFFGPPRRRKAFAKVCEDVLIRAGVSYEVIAGEWTIRERKVRDIIARLMEPSSL